MTQNDTIRVHLLMIILVQVLEFILSSKYHLSGEESCQFTDLFRLIKL